LGTLRGFNQLITELIRGKMFWETVFCTGIVGLTSFNNHISLTTKKRGTQGMVPPTGASPPRARVGNAPDYPQVTGVLQAVHVTIAKQDALLAMRLQDEPLTTPYQQITDQPTERLET